MKISTLILTSTVLLASAGLAIAQDAGAAAGGGAGGRGGAMRAACADDMTKLCAGKTGRDVRACLMENKDKASAGCQAALSAAPAGGAAP
jgi:hypothetical protein